VRLLLDENLQRQITVVLAAAGHDVVHVADRGLLGQPDEVIMGAAVDEQRTLVTADTDFGALLALSGTPVPSVLLLRRGERRANQRATQILEALEVGADALESGALVVAEQARVRIRRLPMDRDE
jgi:predicted nuclease of predicted toxin-antitoxin system